MGSTAKQALSGTLSGDGFIGTWIIGPGGIEGGTASVTEGNCILNCYAGSNHDSFSTKDQVVRDNYFSNVFAALFQNMGLVSFTTTPIVLKSLTRDGTTAHAETNKPHGFIAGDPVAILNKSSNPPASSDADNNYYGFFAVTPTGQSTFDYPMGAVPDHSPPPSQNHTPAYGAPFFREWDYQRLLDSLTFAVESGSYVATATTMQEHGLYVGEFVLITKASEAAYNGFFEVTHVTRAVPSAMPPILATFKYRFRPNEQPNANSTSGYFGRFWQVGNLVYENNIVDLMTSLSPSGNLAPVTGFSIGGAGQGVPQAYVFRRLTIRENLVRHVDNASDPTQFPYAVFLDSCENAIVDGNIIKLDRTAPIQHTNSKTVYPFNNRTPSGALLRGSEYGTNKIDPDLETQVEDALSMSLL